MQGLGELPVSVNVSFRQLRSGTLDSIVARVLEETGLEPSHLDLEITEQMCSDGHSETAYGATAFVRIGSRTFEGCAARF